MATRQTIMGGTSGVPATDGSSIYTGLMGNGNIAWSATEENHTQLIPTNGTLTNFKVGVTTAPGAGNSWAFTIRKGSSGGASGDTTLSVTIAESAVLSSLDTDEVSVVAGDRVCIKAIGTSTPTAAGAVYWRCDFIPDTDGETILMSNTAGANILNNNYHSLIGGKANDVEADAQTLFPTNGTLKKFYVELINAPTAGNSWHFYINVASIHIGIADTATTGQNLVNTVDVTAGDLASIHVYTDTTPASTPAKFGIVFLPDTQGEFITCATTDDATSSTAVEYQHLNCGDSALTGTETEQHNLAAATTAKAIYVSLQTSPSTNDWFFTLRRNATTTTTLTVTLNNVTSGNAAVDVAISADDLLDTMVDATAGTATSKSRIAYLFYNAPTGEEAAFVPRVMIF